MPVVTISESNKISKGSYLKLQSVVTSVNPVQACRLVGLQVSTFTSARFGTI
ncbi:hypothetical protein Glove_360g32 [Diversispora epigaea]|uniref:Uncharacterized protein n=1 Tax=Diversispora epigaea TaxID=1348612 RepID=A0A397HA58_9GLOM|nr:hypothetical protein Glove_360g32 [Diversispora epigaea]